MNSSAMCDLGRREMGSGCNSPAGEWLETGQGVLDPWVTGKYGCMGPLENLRADRHRNKKLSHRFMTWGRKLKEGLLYLLLDGKPDSDNATHARQYSVRLRMFPFFDKLVRQGIWLHISGTLGDRRG